MRADGASPGFDLFATHKSPARARPPKRTARAEVSPRNATGASPHQFTQMAVMICARLPHIVLAGPPPSAPKAAMQSALLFTALFCDVHAPPDAVFQQLLLVVESAVHAVLLQALFRHSSSGVNSCAHAGPLVGSTMAMQPDTLASKAPPCASKISPPVPEVPPASAAPTMQALHDAFAEFHVLQVVEVAVALAHAVSQAVSCDAVHAPAWCTTGTYERMLLEGTVDRGVHAPASYPPLDEPLLLPEELPEELPDELPEELPDEPLLVPPSSREVVVVVLEQPTAADTNGMAMAHAEMRRRRYMGACGSAKSGASPAIPRGELSQIA